MKMNKIDIQKLLRCLDKKLSHEEQLVICGGGALSLAFGGHRTTVDIDILAPVPLSRNIKEKAKEVAQEMNIDVKWLNDDCKGFADYLLSGWKTGYSRIET